MLTLLRSLLPSRSVLPQDSMTVTRHFTSTGFVVHEGQVLLHWHPKVKAWLPPGGHIEENEDPVQAVLREVQEETGLEVEVVPTGSSLELDYPAEVYPPYTIMVEDIHDPIQGFHRHIDMIYFCRPVGPPGRLNEGWLWVTAQTLKGGVALPNGESSDVPPADVRLLAQKAIQAVED